MPQFVLRKFRSLVHDHFQPITRKEIVDVHFRLQFYYSCIYSHEKETERCVVNWCSCFRNFLTMALCWFMCPVTVALETQRLEKKVHGYRRIIITDNCAA